MNITTSSIRNAREVREIIQNHPIIINVINDVSNYICNGNSLNPENDKDTPENEIQYVNEIINTAHFIGTEKSKNKNKKKQIFSNENGEILVCPYIDHSFFNFYNMTLAKKKFLLHKNINPIQTYNK